MQAPWTAPANAFEAGMGQLPTVQVQEGEVLNDNTMADFKTSGPTKTDCSCAPANQGCRSMSELDTRAFAALEPPENTLLQRASQIIASLQVGI